MNYKIKLEYICLLSIWGLVSLISYVTQIGNQLPFSDTDDYMRLVYVWEYMNGNLGWYDHVIARSNVPFGCDIHWTRLYDLILISGAYIFKPFCNTLKDALFNWSTIVTSVISCFSIIEFYKICRNFFSKELCVLSGIVFMLHPIIYAQTRAFRPDHHAFLILLAVIMVRCFMDFIISLKSKNYQIPAFKLATAYSLAITASPELLIVLLPLEFFFIVHWCVVRSNSKAIAIKSWYWALTTAICYLIFSSDGYHAIRTIDYDKISIVHVSIAFASAIFWTVMNRLNIISTPRRAVLRVICVGFPIIAIICAAFPDIIYLMSGKISPELKTTWLNKVTEMQSPFSYAGDIMYWLFFILFLLVLHGGIFICKRYLNKLNLQHKVLIIYAFVVLLLYSIIGSITYRVSYYFAIFSIPVLMVSLLNTHCISCLRQYRGHATLVLFAVLIYVIPTSLAVIANNKPDKNEIEYKSVIQFLKTIHPHSTILAPESLNPIILFYTNHSVIAAPYHRQEYGILAGCKVFNSQTATLDELPKILKTSNVSYIIVPVNNSSNICKQLIKGPLPKYLERIDTPVKNIAIFRALIMD